MTSSQAYGSGKAGDAPAVAAMRHAAEEVTQLMDEELSVGAVAGMLDVTCELWDLMDQCKLRVLLRLARIHASGDLAEVGGQGTLARWITHALRVPQREAYALAVLAQLLFGDKLPETRKALDAHSLSVGEAATIAKAVERATKNRDKRKFEDADRFRQRMDAGIMAAKKNNPTLSSNELLRTGRDVAAELDPTRVEDQHRKAYDNRRADLARTFEGSYYLQTWGPDADAELIEKALAAFSKPHDSDKPEVSKAERVYDGFMAMVKAALGHQNCTKPPGPLAMINITVPLDVFNGRRKARAEAAAAQDGKPGSPGFATTQDGQVMAMEAVWKMAPDSVLRRVITDPTSGKPLDVGHGVRSAPEQIRTAANHGHTTCAWAQGCDVPISGTEADHIHSYSRGGKTSADNIQPLCSFHNRLKYRREKNPHRTKWNGRPRRRPPDPDPPPDAPPDPAPRE
ncbi:HNH endonuclease signature motif containing protein [Nocardiopsis ganjiahuensis]|uniref:HNH endonuclease signature motif containing protein n=1 Tax=Nocardiopsis ganjiahuensis TaxID=239984 RepID=UPI0009FFAAED|nr:HNH endonuclease signature motif containing protein [Nocardiopsis ganjiahuensis]